MYTIEIIPYNPATHDATTHRNQNGQKAHTLLDLGGLLVLFLFLTGFIGPLIWFGLYGPASEYVGSGLELRVLMLLSALAVFLPLLQIFVHIRRFGGSIIRSNRDRYPALHGLPGRIARAHANLIESLLPFAITVIGAQMLHISNVWTVSAALLYLGARLVHTLTYLLGITILRSAAFYAGATASLVILYQLLSR